MDFKPNEIDIMKQIVDKNREIDNLIEQVSITAAGALLVDPTSYTLLSEIVTNLNNQKRLNSELGALVAQVNSRMDIIKTRLEERFGDSE